MSKVCHEHIDRASWFVSATLKKKKALNKENLRSLLAVLHGK